MFKSSAEDREILKGLPALLTMFVGAIMLRLLGFPWLMASMTSILLVSIWQSLRTASLGGSDKVYGVTLAILGVVAVAITTTAFLTKATVVSEMAPWILGLPIAAIFAYHLVQITILLRGRHRVAGVNDDEN